MSNRYRYFKIRHTYQSKRCLPGWTRRKRQVVKLRDLESLRIEMQKTLEKAKQNHKRNKFLAQRKKKFREIIAPKDFSFVNNTDALIEYFNQAEFYFRRGSNVRFNIDNIDDLSSDAIALMIAKISDDEYLKGSLIAGQAPQKPDLRRLFTESGFYNYVYSEARYTARKGNLLHRETFHKVVPEMAESCTLEGLRHTFRSSAPFEPLYEILIECMSNSTNHANPNKKNTCKWWSYVYTVPNTRRTCYSFIDLGVGIFESMKTKGYFDKLVKTVGMKDNISYVQDLLEGRIQSRVDEDNEIRGKGIPEIVTHSTLPEFSKFYIISNDVRINVKSKEAFQLKHNFRGTFFYWEIEV